MAIIFSVAYSQGWCAYFNHQSCDTNPYTLLTENFRAWDEGWKSASKSIFCHKALENMREEA